MVVTAIQAILIAFAVGIIVGGIIGWKFTFNMRLAKIQEQQIIITKLRSENSKLKSEIRAYKFSQTREKVGNAANAAAKGAGSAASLMAKGAGGAFSGAVGGIKKLWNNNKKEEETDERKALQASISSDKSTESDEK